MLISLVVPCYNEEAALPILYQALCEVRDSVKDSGRTFEFIFVNDGSRDKTAEVIRGLASSDKDVKYVFFSRNFGKEAAMYAGMEAAKGEYVAILFAQLRKPSLKSKTTALPLKPSSRRNSPLLVTWLQSFLRFLSTSNAALWKANVCTVL